MIEATLYSTFKVQNRWLKTHTHKHFYTETAQEEFWIEAHTHKIKQQQNLQT